MKLWWGHVLGSSNCQLAIPKGAALLEMNYSGPRLIRRRPIAANLSLGRNLLMCGAICIRATRSPAK
jgi:hypothetical protein